MEEVMEEVMEEIIEVGDALWVVIDIVALMVDDGLFKIRDDAGGEVLVDREEIPRLVEVLTSLREKEEKEVV